MFKKESFSSILLILLIIILFTIIIQYGLSLKKTHNSSNSITITICNEYIYFENTSIHFDELLYKLENIESNDMTIYLINDTAKPTIFNKVNNLLTKQGYKIIISYKNSNITYN